MTKKKTNSPTDLKNIKKEDELNAVLGSIKIDLGKHKGAFYTLDELITISNDKEKN